MALGWKMLAGLSQRNEHTNKKKVNVEKQHERGGWRELYIVWYMIEPV